MTLFWTTVSTLKQRSVVTSDRKHKLIKKQFENKFDIRFVSNPNARIGKKSKTTYADWCERYGFKYAADIPQSWIDEKKI